MSRQNDHSRTTQGGFNWGTNNGGTNAGTVNDSNNITHIYNITYNISISLNNYKDCPTPALQEAQTEIEKRIRQNDESPKGEQLNEEPFLLSKLEEEISRRQNEHPSTKRRGRAERPTRRFETAKQERTLSSYSSASPKQGTLLLDPERVAPSSYDSHHCSDCWAELNFYGTCDYCKPVSS